LIEKFNVALSPGLTLLPPQEALGQGTSVLAAGLSEARQGFTPLPAVADELLAIAAVVPDRRQLFNETFTNEDFAKSLERKPTNTLHLATHGQFGSSAEETFILTWDERIGIVELGNLLKRRNRDLSGALELLVLSACSTAAGDDRATLGLAGVAVRSGARSTLAGLWPLQDRAAAAFMREFYQALARPGISRAEAVRQAQLALMADPQYAEPYLWAPFVLVGNWL
ncbi:MAG: CHAT domain-containing protein, partial [Cyanobacteria bacterium J06641_5]